MLHPGIRVVSPRKPRPAASVPRAGRRRYRPVGALEALEGRILLANTFVVNSLTDTGAMTGPFAGDLRYCVTNALDGDTITFDPGISGPSSTTVDLTTVGDTTFGPSAFLISKAITIDGSAVTNLIVERSTAPGTPNFRIFDVAPTGSLTLEHLTVSNGLALDDGQPGVTPGSSDAQGGAILDNGGTVTLVDATVENNRAQAVNSRTAQGGGIYAVNGTVRLTRATLSGNTAVGGDGADSASPTADGAPGGGGQGGGLYAGGGTLVADGATIAGNTALGGNGGQGYGNFYIDVYTDGGTGGSAEGGGLFTIGVSPTLDRVAITGNTASGGRGGPMSYVCTCSTSRPGEGGNARGGGISADGGTVRLTGATLSRNTAAGGNSGPFSGISAGGNGQGGGLGASGVALVLDGVTVSGNAARGGTGGAALGGGVSTSGGSVMLTNNTITGNAANGSSVRGAGLSFSGGSVVLTDNTITGNAANGGNVQGSALYGGNVQGGALYSSAISLTMENDTIANNTAKSDGYATVQGGGLFLAVGAGSATLTNDTIANNSVETGFFASKVSIYGITQGGGLYASVGAGGSITLTHDTISANSAHHRSQGGGLFITAAGTAQVVLRHSTITNNLADNGPRPEHGGIGGDAQGGGLFISGGTATLEDDVITGNSALAGDGDGWILAGNGQGGGIYAAGVNMSLTGSTIAGNTVIGGVYATGTFLPNGVSQGGGLFATGGRAILSNDTISGNTAVAGSFFYFSTHIIGSGQGGGLFASGVSLTLANVTVANNSARGVKFDTSWRGTAQGGGLYIAAQGDVRATLTNVTVANNSTLGSDVRGGGLEVAGSVTMDNTLVALNTQTVGNGPTTPSDIDGAVDPASAYNLIGTGGAGGLMAGVNHNQVGVADPRLGPLADNGGPTMTLALLLGSPAFNAGDNDIASSAGLATDQRGLPRIVAGRVDVGAFESQVVLAGPSVTGVQRFGYHARPTTLVLTFDQALDPASATNLANYQLRRRHRQRPIRIVAATYDPAALTVTLHPAARLPLRNSYVLTISGAPPEGLKNTQGLFLEGQGHVGTSYTTTITRKNLVWGGRPRVLAAGSIEKSGRERPRKGVYRS